jgi:ferredoxin
MKHLKTDPGKCRGHLRCQSVCSKLYFKEDNPAKSAIRVQPAEAGGFAITVCTQCGECVAECPTMALTVSPQGVVMLNKALCIGCLACVARCPIHAMMYVPGMPTPFKCIACGACAKECPEKALEIAL